MKKILVLAFCLLVVSSNNSKAQSSIINSHYFDEDVTVAYQPVLDSLVVYEDYGNNMIWDYNKIIFKDDSYKRSIELSKNTPHSNKFPESNFVIVGENKDYVYLNVENSKTEFIAFVPPDSSFYVHNYQPWSLSCHPMNFGDTIQSPVARLIKIGDRTVFREGKVITTAIGYGQLKLPNRTYEQVLKIKEVQYFFNPTKTTFYKATTYHWVSNDSNFPLMSCNEIIDRNSKGEESITRFAQVLVNEENTHINKFIEILEDEKSPTSHKD